ncbi:MAG: PHB depolymerase family esterase [Micropepsaceae bacterium]
MFRSSALLIAFLCGFATVTSHAGERDRSLAINGKPRQYTLVMPEHVSGPLPLLIVYHGGGQDAGRARKYTRFDEYAGREQIIVVYPQGLDNNWNDGRNSADLMERAAASTNDLEFTSQIIAQLAGERLVDPSHVYLTGASNGGIMALYAGCKLGGRIAGIAPVVANLPVDWKCGASGLPAMFIHGTEDAFMPYAGGKVAAKVQRKDLGTVLSADATIDAFSAINDCHGVKETRRIDNVGYDKTVAVVTLYDCTRAPLKHYVIEGGGHTWPGARTGILADWVLGKTSEEFSATTEILGFFKSLK